MSFSYASVIETKALNPRMVRITLQVEDLEALNVRQAADSAVAVYLPGTDEGRNYSVRHQRGDLIDLDVVLHARGMGTEWAARTRPGDRVGLDHARSWYRPDPDARWQLLVTDLSGLPATARILEELSPAVAATVIAEVADAQDLEYLPTHPRARLIPSIGTGNGNAPGALAGLVRELTLPPGRGYCWFAGEAAQSRAVRKHFRSLGYQIDQLDITGYWRFDSETWDAKFALVESDVLAVYERALADGKGDKVAFEEFDEACERIGL
ncbi:siderophore-interacting protein [Mycolicibacterium goodii]|uniref:Siderophore-interacting protein n=1 Tax=Mycolicibacterium goodii TaxID=134601 RepID=A0A0K0X2I1_MYCGD|nr:siderophore-interacting protein [Mycolicibacterium goodii]